MQLSNRKKIIIYTLLIIFSIIIFLPFYGMVITSIKTDKQIQSVSTLSEVLIANPIRWQNYPDVFRYVPFLRYYWNTFYVTILSIIGAVISCSLVAYGFARFRWPGRDIVFLIMLSTMMLPPQVTVISHIHNVLKDRLGGFFQTFMGTKLFWNPFQYISFKAVSHGDSERS